jgi:hypothetical protein
VGGYMIGTYSTFKYIFNVRLARPSLHLTGG